MFKIDAFLQNSANDSTQFASCPFCVCAKKNSGVCTQPWFCKKTSWTNPYNTILANQKQVVDSSQPQDRRNAVVGWGRCC